MFAKSMNKCHAGGRLKCVTAAAETILITGRVSPLCFTEESAAEEFWSLFFAP